MAGVFVPWVVTLIGILILAGMIGKAVGGSPWWILIDNRGRYSLTHLQIVTWTMVVLPLVGGLFIARLRAGVAGALDFAIPDELLLVMGVSLTGAALSTAIKYGKDAARPDQVAASNGDDRPRFTQVFLVEEGELADKIVDIAKFQNFLLTIALVTAYLALAISTISKAASIPAIELPGFDDRFVALLGTSHAGYLAGKLPNPAGKPEGLTVDLRARKAAPAAAPPSPPAGPTYQPRNPNR